jgi:RNA polymerase sigma-70 factor (ECF subfamily)
MDPLRTTTTALLDGLLDPSAQQVWQQFDGRFRPILRGFAMKLGLSYADAEDITQEALARFVKAYRAGKYDRSRGKLSSWLVAIAQRCIFDLKHSRAGRLERRGESAIISLSDTNALDVVWDEECRRVVLEKALAELRGATKLDEKTIRAFELVALEQKTAQEAARITGLSVDSVYAAKHRCLSQLREILARLNEIYELG